MNKLLTVENLAGVLGANIDIQWVVEQTNIPYLRLSKHPRMVRFFADDIKLWLRLHPEYKGAYDRLESFLRGESLRASKIVRANLPAPYIGFIKGNTITISETFTGPERNYYLALLTEKAQDGDCIVLLDEDRNIITMPFREVC